MNEMQLIQQFGIGIGSAAIMAVALFRILNGRINSLKKEVNFSKAKNDCMTRFIEKIVAFIPEKKRNVLLDSFHNELEELEKDFYKKS